MSVLVSDRTESSLSYYYDAYTLQIDMTKLLLRDFGIKDKVRDVNFYCQIHKMSKEDAMSFKDILDRNNLGSKLIEEYPDWLIDKFRTNIMNNLTFLLDSITMAHNIQTVQNKRQFYDKQSYQIKAIGYCKNLLREMQYAMNILPIDAEKLMPYVEKN